VPAPRRRTPAEIEQIVTAFAGSGLNRTAFCGEHAISLATLDRYLKRLRGEHASEGTLVAVEVAGRKLRSEHEVGRSLAVVLASGCRIEVGTGFDGPTLQRLLELLEK
jgi:hypothetical protein